MSTLAATAVTLVVVPLLAAGFVGALLDFLSDR